MTWVISKSPSPSDVFVGLPRSRCPCRCRADGFIVDAPGVFRRCFFYQKHLDFEKSLPVLLSCSIMPIALMALEADRAAVTPTGLRHGGSGA